MNAELEENKELAQNRHCELEKLRQDLEEVTTQNEKLKVGVTFLKGRKMKLFADQFTYILVGPQNLRGKRKMWVLLVCLFIYLLVILYLVLKSI